MKSKALLITLIFVLLAVLLAACGGTDQGSGNTAANEPEAKEPAGSGTTASDSKDTVKLTMWGGVPEEAGPKAAIDAWNAAHPDIQVEYIRFVNDDAGNLKLDTALVSGEGVDLFVNYAKDKLGKRIDAGTAANLSEYADFNIDDIMGPLAKDWQFDGKYYGMPTNNAMTFIWLNKNALDEAGLPVPPLDWTMADLADYAKKLKHDKRWGYLQVEDMFWANLDGSLAGEYTKDGKSNFDQLPVRASLETYYKMMHEDKSIPTYGEQIATKMPVDTMFLKGEGAMLGAGTWIFRNANNLKDYPRDFKIAFATVPKPLKDQEKWSVPSGLGDVVSINDKSAHKKEAWEFLKWYANEGVMYLAPGGRVPASKNADKDKAIESMLKGVENLYDMDSLKSVVFGDYPIFTSTIDLQTKDALKEELSRYLLKDEPLSDMIRNLVKRHNDILAKQK